MKNIIFMGSDKISIPLLEYLHKEGAGRFRLVGIVSQPDRPKGRGKKVQPNAISAWALERGVDLQRPDKPDEGLKAWMEEKSVDLVLVMAYGHILREAFLTLPPLGMLNFHGSVLPRYRGASPIEAALASGEKEVGITLMEMVKKMDAGGMLDIETCAVDSDDTIQTLREKMGLLCVPLIDRNMEKILAGNMEFQPQDEALVTFTRKITKTDSWLDFYQPAEVLHNRTRAIGGYFKYREEVLKIGKTGALAGVGAPGKVMRSGDEGLVVGTGGGLLEITQLQKPGGKMLNIGDFLRGYPILEGEELEGNPEGEQPLVSKEPFKWRPQK